MRIITQEKIRTIIKNHMHWLREDVEGWENMRADFSETDLSVVDLRGVNLKRANLEGAKLNGSYLRGVSFREANLEGADLSGAYLIGAHLGGANLKGAKFRWAYLCGADLSGADLKGVDFRGAYLREADLIRAKDVPFIPTVCPEEGSFTAYKKASEKIVVLRIPHDAKRLSATGRKCRCNKAKVLRIENIDGSDSGLDEVESDFDDSFIYRVGETVKVRNFDEDRWDECSTGIHFFINRQEAVEY